MPSAAAFKAIRPEPKTDAEFDWAHLAKLAAAFAENAAVHDRDASFPHENVDRLRENGVLNLTIPRNLGGYGGGLGDATKAVEIIGAGDPATALILAMHYIQHGIAAAKRHWPKAIHQKLAEASITEGALLNQLRVEPELGSPTRGGVSGTVARKVDGGWRITGHKRYATGWPAVRWFAVWARTEDFSHSGIWLVPTAAEGVTTEPTWDHFGMRATASDDLFLNDVFVPDENAIDLRPKETAMALDVHHTAWFSIALVGIYLGVAKSARDWLARYLHERKPASLGAPLATVERIRDTVGEIQTLIRTAERLIYGLTRDYDENAAAVPPTDYGIVKTTAVEHIIRAVELATTVTGNPGLSRSNPLERHFRDVHCARVHTPQLDVVHAAAGRAVLSAGA